MQNVYNQYILLKQVFIFVGHIIKFYILSNVKPWVCNCGHNQFCILDKASVILEREDVAMVSYGHSIFDHTMYGCSESCRICLTHPDILQSRGFSVKVFVGTL